MKHKIQKVELFIGVIIFLGGLLTYGLGVHQLLPVPRPDLVVYGTTLIGIILIFMGCDIFSKPTKEDYIRIVRVSPFFNFIWGNELACLFLAPKHFGAFFVILTMKGKIRQT